MTKTATATLESLTTAGQLDELARLEAAACAARDLMIAHAAVARASLERVRKAAEEARAHKKQADADLALAAALVAELAQALSADAATTQPAVKQEEAEAGDLLRVGDLTPGERAVIDDVNNDRAVLLNAALDVEKQQAADAERQAADEESQPASVPPPSASNGRKSAGGRRR